MKVSELIREHFDAICEEMKDAYRCVVDCDGRVQETIYIWSDGEIMNYEDVQGGNGYLVSNDSSRSIHAVYTVDAPYIDWRDYCDYASLPEDESSAEYEAMRQETIDWMVSEFDAREMLQIALWQAEEDEKYLEDD